MERPSNHSRRTFLKSSSLLAAGAVLSTVGTPRVHAAGTGRIKVASIGCGSRGRGAVLQALEADTNIVLWSIADAFEDKVAAGVSAIRTELEKKEQADKIDVPMERRFVGLDGYKQAIDAMDPGDVVLLTTPPAFRPLHFAYAVEKGLNVFAEKPVAVDIPGLKWLMETNKKAEEKGLKVGVGLNNRHYFRTEEAVKAIHDGKIGDVTSSWVYRMHPSHILNPRGNQSPLEFQLRHIFNFNWTTGGFIVDALIHNLDICSWAKGSRPVAAQGQGGQLIRPPKDQMIDHAAVEYRFADGQRMMMFAQTMDNTYATFEAMVHGTKGSMVLGEGVGEPKMFADWNANRQRKDGAVWQPESPGNNSYQTEHDRFFEAIRDNQPWNEMQRGIDATFTPIMGRMAMESGQFVTAEAAWASTFEYVPNIAGLSFDGSIIRDKCLNSSSY